MMANAFDQFDGNPFDQFDDESYAGRVGHNLATFGKSALSGGLNLAATAQQLNPTSVIAKALIPNLPGNAEQTRAAAEYVAPQINQSDLGDKVESFLGGAIPTLGAAAMSGGAAEGAPLFMRILGGARSMSLPAAETGRSTYDQSTEAGLTPAQAAVRAAAAGGGTLAMGALPQVFGQSALARALTGGLSGAALNEGQRVVENLATPSDRPDLLQKPDVAGDVLQGLFGAVLGAAHPSQTPGQRVASLSDAFVRENPPTSDITAQLRANPPTDPIAKATQDALTGVQPPPTQPALVPDISQNVGGSAASTLPELANGRETNRSAVENGGRDRGIEPANANAQGPVSAPEKVAEPAYSRASNAPDTPAFHDFFGDSKVTDKQGQPLEVHHGTAEDFNVFESGKAGDATGHATSPLGHFLTEDKALADRYAENASEGRPADKRVISGYARIENPYTMPLHEAQAIESQDQAKAIRADLERQGYDGIRIPESKTWVAFDSNQIKDANNVGTFDKTNPDIRYRTTGEPETGGSIPRARNIIANEWGDQAVSELEKNGLHLTPNSELPSISPELSDSERAKVKGATLESGDVHVFPENHANPRDVLTTVVHEAVHKAMPDERVNNLAGSIEAAAKNSPKIAESLAAIPKDTPTEHRNQEVVAQTLGDLYNQPIGRRVLNQVKLGLVDLGIPMKWLNAHEAVLREIGVQNLRAWRSGDTKTFTTPGATYQPKQEGPVDATKNPEAVAQPKAASDMAQERTPPETRPASEAVKETIGTKNAMREESRASEPTKAPESEKNQASELPVEAPPTKQEATQPADRTGIKNRMVEESRVKRDESPLQSEKGATLTQRQEAAHETLARDPKAGERLVDEVMTNPRPLTQAETDVFNLHHNNVERARDAAVEHINNLPKDAGTMDKARAQIDLLEREDELNRVENAARKAGTEASRSLSARKAEVTKEGLFKQLSGLIQAKQGGKALDEAQKTKIRELSDQLKAANDKLAERDAQEAKDRTTKAASKPARKQQAQDRVDALLEKLKNLKSAEPSISRASDKTQFARAADTPLSITKEIARELVKGGEDDAQRLIDAVHAAVGKLTGFDRNRVRDIIAGVIKDTGIAPTKSEYRARMDNIRAELKADIKSENPDKIKQDRLRKQLADLQAQRDSGILKEPTKRAAVMHTDETFALQQEVNKAKREIEKMALKAQLANRSLPEKIADGAIKVQRLFILSSVSALQKLPVAATVRIISNRADEAAGSGLRLIPGISNIAEIAPRHGAGLSFKGDVVEGAKGIAEAFRKGSKDQLTKGFDELDDAYGSKYKHADEWANLSGRVHSALKEPAKLDEFYRSFYKRSQHAYQQELKRTGSEDAAQTYINKPSTKYLIGEASYKDAMESIMQGDNALIDSVDSFMRNISRSSTGGKVVEKLFNALVPIKKVPANIVKETSSYALGGLKAAPGLVRAAREGVDKLSPKDADYIMKNLKKQTVGVALMGIGYALGPSILGGIEDTFESSKKSIAEYYKRLKGGQPLAGHAKVGDTDLNPNFFHASPMTVLQAGAQYRAMREKEGNKDVLGGFNDLLHIAGSYALEEGPVVGSLYKSYKYAHEGNKAGEIAGNLVKSAVVPGALENVAKYQDYAPAKDQNKNNALGHALDLAGGQFHAQTRYPQSILQSIETGIPDTPLTRAFSRKTVPTHRPKP